MTMQARYLIVGYGSLMAKESRNRTSELTGIAVPIRFRGFRREWNARVVEMGMTALGVVPERNGIATGVLVQATDINAFDMREQGYSRMCIEWCDIETCDGTPIPFAQDEQLPQIYVPDRPMISTDPEAPIVLSYLCVILNSLLDEWGPDFSREFLQTTRCWGPILDDLAAPHYQRALTSIPHEAEIRQMLQRDLPDLNWVV
jgi:hypothetical protein